MTDQASPEGGATPSFSKGANPSFAAAKAEAEAKAPAPKEGAADSPPAAVDPGEKKSEAVKEDGRDLRIKELTRRLRQSERNYERAMRMAEDRGNHPAPQPSQPQQQAQPTRKTFKDFNYDEAAYDAYKESEITARIKVPNADELAEQVRQEMATKDRRSKFEQRAQKFAESTEDYDEVIGGDWACSKPMAEAIEESEEGPAVAYYLAQNQELAAQLAKLGPVQAGREIDRIERKLVDERKKAAEKPVSKAPPPPPKIEGADPGSVESSPLKMGEDQLRGWSDAKFRKWREGTMARRR